MKNDKTFHLISVHWRNRYMEFWINYY